ncbi:hypothetical protein M9Y10_032191 [Tritrichomonas musculus]|uniref:Helicase ATP-binding domain-containing protein n=1 Tax=Tritrichomonas musculus TaxID=1915356 RepID=A0ABR2GZC7_9EUKA
MLQQQPNVQFSPLDVPFIQQVTNKAHQMESITENLAAQMKSSSFSPTMKVMIESTIKIMQNVTDNLVFLNNTDIFQEDFNKAIHTISTAYDSYLKSLTSITDVKKESSLLFKIKINLENFAQSIVIFSTVFDEIMTTNSKLKDQSAKELINTRIGLESALFNFAVTVEPTDEKPFFKSRFVELYKCYNDINKIQNNIAAIKSVCGTGKTLCLPIILLCRSLKEGMNVPFLLITQPSPKHVESKEKFFNQAISKYVTITSDPDGVREMINEYEKTLKIPKLVLAVLTPHNLLPLMYQLRMNKKFYPSTRIIVDEIHQRTFHSDVLIAKIAQFDQNLKAFPLNLNVILMSATISPAILKPYNGKLQVTTLIKYPQFEIIEKQPIIESNVQKINNEIVRDQTIMAIEDMANFESNIEEGHILCFLSGIGICTKLKNSVTSLLKNSEETKTRRKIVILQTTLKPNETIESYFERLREEYLVHEGIREGKNYKNEFLYIVPLVLSGLVEDAIYELAQNEFPGDLKKINKLICSTPMIESSFTIDRLSVVVDSGLFKETEFDRNTCLTTLTEKQTSKESMDQRKGRLGRTMKGLYISIHEPNNYVPYSQVPPVLRLDLSTNVLLMKDICIDFEKMNNLPTMPNQGNLQFALNTLKYIKAIDPTTMKITPFGHEILNYPFISIYYAAAILNFRESFPEGEKMFANFIAAYISTVVTMDTLLVQEDMSEKMSRFFKEDSDITTLINPLNILLRSDLTDNDKLRDLVESYGFSYAQFLVFKTHMQEITDLTFPGKTTADVINHIGGFVKKYEGITGLVDMFIPEIAKVFPKWKQIHTIRYKYVTGAGGFDSRPTIVFTGSQNLMFNGQRQRNAEVRISRRPGWNGIMIPTECYCFNISRNSNANMNYGRLVHRMSKSSTGAISSIECDKIALNPWFDVLLDTYFQDDDLNIQYFSNVVKTSNHSGRPIFEYRKFHYSNAGERVFISFIPNDERVKQIIIDGINKCLKLMPFTPRSILVFRNDVQAVVEITSIGTEFYDTSMSSFIPGDYLDRRKIDFCLNNIGELAKSNSSIRICALFTRETCQLKEYDQKKLYFINTNYRYSSNIESVISRRISCLRQMEHYQQQSERSLYYSASELTLFQFPSKFIHPALLYHQESLDCILNWFRINCKYAKVVKVIGHRLLMTQSDIFYLQQHLRNEKEKIKSEMNLNYVVTPISSQIYSKAYLEIREHPTWDYNKRFKVIITTKDEENEVKELIDKYKEEVENKEDGTLCCCYICDDPDDPVLTNYPITIYYQDGSTYTNKMCRDCLACNLQVATESFYSNGKIDQKALESISFKPAVIPSITSKETKDGLECWPQIPLGQMISALITNDDELSGLVSAWLHIVSEFSLRTQAKDQFTFCPDHPHHLFNLLNKGDKTYKCKVDNCKNVLCEFCMCWHDSKYICEEKKSGKGFTWKTKCPKCKAPTFKDGGCNHITCPCGCHWCYKCCAGFTTAEKCYEHLSQVHGGCFDYHFDD